MANCPTNRYKETLKYDKAGHNYSWELLFMIVVGNITGVEEDRQFGCWIGDNVENKKYEQ